MEYFSRKEKKYFVDKSVYEALIKDISKYFDKNEYHDTKISTIYFDSLNEYVIRDSLMKPRFKQKLRIRYYDDNINNSYIELKKKYYGHVFKIRKQVNYSKYINDIYAYHEDEDQTGKEIVNYLKFNKDLVPRIKINAYRKSWMGKQDKNLRITFDERVTYSYDINSSDYLDSLPNDKVLMEIKCNLAYPLWLVDILNKYKIYPISYSKYGTIHKRNLKGENYESVSINSK